MHRGTAYHLGIAFHSCKHLERAGAGERLLGDTAEELVRLAAYREACRARRQREREPAKIAHDTGRCADPAYFLAYCCSSGSMRAELLGIGATRGGGERGA